MSAWFPLISFFDLGAHPFNPALVGILLELVDPRIDPVPAEFIGQGAHAFVYSIESWL